jgi:hypothetical protein
MKNLIYLITILFSFNLAVFANSSCREAVITTYEKKLQLLNDNITPTGAFYGGTGLFVGVSVGAMYSIPLIQIITVPIGLGVMIYDYGWGRKFKQNKFETILELAQAQEVGGRYFNRLLSKAQKIEPQLSTQDLTEIISEGLESGELCERNRIFRPRKLKRYILQTLRHRS